MHEPAGRTLAAAGMVMAGMAVFGFVDNLIRIAAGLGGLWQFQLLRSGLAVALIAGGAWAVGYRLRPVSGRAVAVRSALGSAAMVVYFACLGLLPIAEVVAGLFTAPLFVVIYETAFFGARVGPRRAAAVIVGFIGILIALRPEAGGFSGFSLLPALAGALYGAGNVATRRLCAGEATGALLGAFFLSMAAWGALGLIVLAIVDPAVPEGSAGWALRGWVPPVGAYLVLIVVQAVGSIAGVGLSIRAYQIADATTVAVFENTLLVFATLWAIVLWGEYPGPGTLVGLVLIAAAGALIAIRTEAPQPLRSPATSEPS